MSSIKKTLNSHPPVTHYTKADPGVPPPRYQPPPRPPGILKPYPSQNNPPHNSYPLPVTNNEKHTNFNHQKSIDVYPYPDDKIEPKPQYLNPPQYPAPPPVIKSNSNKPTTPTNFNSNVNKIDEQLLNRGHPEMLKFVRVNKPDTETINSITPRIVPDQNELQNKAEQGNRRIQSYINEIQALKEANQRLGDDNQELRDLCCFLDDDRQKGRKLAREWQRFGRYTASVMRQEVSAYQNKLRQLENKQQELIKDNLELKELCLYLDEERNQNVSCPSCGHGLPVRPGHRDDGDGSSSSTNADEPGVSSGYNTTNSHAAPTPRRTESRERLLEESIQRQRNIFNEQIIQYVRYLEHRVKILEADRQVLVQKLLQNGYREEDLKARGVYASPEDDLSNRPEAVVQALQVLEVRELIERTNESENQTGARPPETTNEMDVGEKALVMEMCNVVWRKLEEGPAARLLTPD